jgi:hypothetical protein
MLHTKYKSSTKAKRVRKKMGLKQNDMESMPDANTNVSTLVRPSMSLDGIAREYLDSKPSAKSDSSGGPAKDATYQQGDSSSVKLSPEQLGFFHPVNLDEEHETSPLPPARSTQLLAGNKPYQMMRQVLPDGTLSIADMVTTDESGAYIPTSELQYHLNPSGAREDPSKRKRDE